MSDVELSPYAADAGGGLDAAGSTTTGNPRGSSIRGLRRWYAVLAGIGWWMVHLVVDASLVPASCAHPDVRWVMQAVTVVTALGTGLAIWWSAKMLAGGTGSGEPDDAGNRQRFLGLFGLSVGIISLLLILWEGSYVVVLSSCTTY